MNAVAHKDYSSGAPIQISVYENRIVIWNNGQLQEGWSVATLQAKHASQPPNPDIANTFFRAGMIESWGMGIEKMKRACLEQGLPAPVLRAEPQGLWVEFAFAKPPASPARAPIEVSVIESVKASAIASGKMSGKTSGKILTYLGRRPNATIPDLAKLLGITERSVERNLQKLQKDQLLRRVGGAKGGHWEVIK
jgi:ATP-dependent DNA helicase RecG